MLLFVVNHNPISYTLTVGSKIVMFSHFIFIVYTKQKFSHNWEFLKFLRILKLFVKNKYFFPTPFPKMKPSHSQTLCVISMNMRYTMQYINQ